VAPEGSDVAHAAADVDSDDGMYPGPEDIGIQGSDLDSDLDSNLGSWDVNRFGNCNEREWR
jgi:hypothetical protein